MADPIETSEASISRNSSPNLFALLLFIRTLADPPFSNTDGDEALKILHIDSSILGAHSVSRDLSSAIVVRQKELHPDAVVIYHDLATEPVAPLTASHLAVIRAGLPPETPTLGEDVARGHTYIDELFASDIIVIGAPMYNFSIAAQLKTWLDRVIVGGRTFRYTDKGPQGLLPSEKRVFIASSRGGAYPAGGPIAALEHHETYLRAALGFIGLTNVTVIRAEGLSFGDETKARAVSEAKWQIAGLTL